METDWLDDLDLTLIRIAEDYVTSLAQQVVPSVETAVVEEEEEPLSFWDTPILPSKPFKRRRLQPPSPPHLLHRKRKRQQEEEDAVVPQRRRLLMRFSLPRPYGVPLPPTQHRIVFPRRHSLEAELLVGGSCPPDFPWGYKRCYFNSVDDPYAVRMSEEALRVALKCSPSAGRKLSLSELGIPEEEEENLGAAGGAAGGGSEGSGSLVVRLKRCRSTGEAYVDPLQFAVARPLLTRTPLT